MDTQLESRIKSFAWRTGMMVVALTVDFALQNLASFNLTDSATLFLGLALGEVSKYLNNKYLGR